MENTDLATELEIIEVKMLLADLSLNLSKNTKMVIASPGTKVWRVELYIKPSAEDDTFFNKTIFIRLVKFFDIYLGYSKEADILVYTKDN